MKTVLKVGLVVAAVLGFGALLVHADAGQPANAIVIPEPASLLLLGTGVYRGRYDFPAAIEVSKLEISQ